MINLASHSAERKVHPSLRRGSLMFDRTKAARAARTERHRIKEFCFSAGSSLAVDQYQFVM